MTMYYFLLLSYIKHYTKYREMLFVLAWMIAANVLDKLLLIDI